MSRPAHPFRWAAAVIVGVAALAGLTFLHERGSAVASAQSTPPPAISEDQERWLFLGKNIGNQQMPEIKELLWRAQQLAFNGVVLNNGVIQTLEYRDRNILRNAAEVSELAKKLGFKVYATIANFAYAEAFFRLDANLAEGLMVQDALFEVRNGQAVPVTELDNPLPNGGFENFDGDELADFDMQDLPGEVTFVDTEVKYSGNASLRYEEPSNNAPTGNARIRRRIQVKPHRLYRVSAWVQTQGYNAAQGSKPLAIAPDGRILNWNRFGAVGHQPWKLHHMVFNSLDYDEIDLYFGTWGGGRGKMWIDDLTIEEIGFVNLLRRESCPLVVRGENGQVYEEGRDFKQLFDPRGPGRNGNAGPAAFSAYHPPPTLELSGGSRISEGERLRISYCHATVIYDHQKVACLWEPRVFDVVKSQVSTIDAAIKPDGYLLGHDEIRVANQCPACRREGRDAAGLLADNLRRCIEIVRDRRADADILVWNDMFDPNHNAKEQYFLVDGDLTGAWQGVPSDVSIVNWAPDRRLGDSASFFSARGLRQIMSMNMDLANLDPAERLASVAGQSGVRGVMYTTWANKYGRMEEFATKMWGAQAAPPTTASDAPLLGGGAARRSRR